MAGSEEGRGRELRPEQRVVAVGGLVASGKSTLARALAERLGAARVEADHVRNQVLVSRHAGDPIASLAPSLEDEVYDELLQRAAAEIEAGRPVVLDACFPRRSERRAARALARTHGRGFAFVECRVPPEVTRERLEARDRLPGRAGWQQIYDLLAAHAEPCDELEPGEHLIVRGDSPLEECVEAVIGGLEALRTPADRSRVSSKGPPAGPEPAAVTFDCWNTLLIEEDWQLAHALRVEALRNAAVQAGSDCSREQAGRAFDVAWGLHMQAWSEGRATGAREVAVDGLRELGCELGGGFGSGDASVALEHLVEHFEEASHSSRVRPLEGARETLLHLRDGGFATALICDTGLTPGRVVRRHLERLGMLDALQVQIFSDEVGVPKPHGRVFRSALAPLGVVAERALHVGDLRRTDVQGARVAGMATVRIRATHDDTTDLAEADWVVQSHAELRELLLRGVSSGPRRG